MRHATVGRTLHLFAFGDPLTELPADGVGALDPRSFGTGIARG